MKHSKNVMLDFINSRVTNDDYFLQTGIETVVNFIIDDKIKCNNVLKNLHFAILCDSFYAASAQYDDTVNYENYKNMIDLSNEIMNYPVAYDEPNDEIQQHFIKMSMFYYKNIVTIDNDRYDLKFHIMVATGMINDNIATYITHKL